MAQKQQEKSHDGDESEEQDIGVIFRGVSGTRQEMKIRPGTRASELLVRLKHQHTQGLTYKLNDALLSVADDGKFLKDPVLQEGDILSVHQNFKGGF